MHPAFAHFTRDCQSLEPTSKDYRLTSELRTLVSHSAGQQRAVVRALGDDGVLVKEAVLCSNGFSYCIVDENCE
ncbi:hypothetical protein H0H81_008183, partial [Sphagnurus paluster]